MISFCTPTRQYQSFLLPSFVIAYCSKSLLPPITRSLVCTPCSGFAVITFTTPPMAPEPYNVEPAPRWTSMRSILDISFKIVIGGFTPAAPILMPSTKYNTWSEPLMRNALEFV